MSARRGVNSWIAATVKIDDTCGMAEVVRTLFAPDARLWARRSVDDRLMVRWPAAWAALARMLLRLAPKSRLRRALLQRSVLSGWSAWSRGDLDVMLVRYAPDCQLDVPPGFMGVGARSSYRGHTGRREFSDDLRESFPSADPAPLEIVDAGDRLVILGTFHVRGGSGVELDTPVGSALWFERGRIVRESNFFDWDDALRAAHIPVTVGRSARPPGVSSTV
jgi:ketosteroid isomerase-like protein